MSTRGRRKHSSQFKAQVALEAIREARTAGEIAGRHGVHPSRVGLWKRVALERLHEVFENGGRSPDDKAELIEQLYQKIGRLQVELDWMEKKPATFSAEELRRWIAPHPQIGIRRQCALTPGAVYFGKASVLGAVGC